MSSGGNKIHRQMQQQQQQSLAQQNQIFNQMMQPSDEQKQWRADQADWRKFIEGGDYSKAPKSSILNFDLWNPAHVQNQREKMANLEGVGAAGLGGDTGDRSLALQFAKERNANAAAQDAGAAYEGAVKSRNSYFEGNALPYAQFEANKMMGLLGNASNNAQYYTQQSINTRPQSMFPALFGAALSAGGSILSNPAVMAAI